MYFVHFDFDSNQLKLDGRVLLEAHQDVQQPIGVFSTRQTHHNFVACIEHAKISQRLTDQAAQLFMALVLLELPSWALLRAGGVLIFHALSQSCLRAACCTRNLAKQQGLKFSANVQTSQTRPQATA